MKKIILALILLCGAVPAFAADQKESAYDRVMRTGVLHCGFIPWPPGFEVDPNTNVIKGPTKELFEAIIKLTGWKVEFVQVALGNNALDLNNGRIDAMCADGPWTITSVKFVDYTTWAAYTPVLAYVRANETRFKSYTDLNDANVTFVGIDGDISADLAALRFPRAKLKTLGSMTDPSQMTMDVSTGKEDVVILDPVTAEGFMKNNPGKIKGIQNAPALAVYPIGMSVKRGEDQLQQTLSRATEMAINIGLVDQKLDLYDPKRRIIYSPAKSYTAGR